jgi:hypothetical protein
MGERRWSDALGDYYDADECDETMYALRVLRRVCAGIDRAYGPEFGRRYREMMLAAIDEPDDLDEFDGGEPITVSRGRGDGSSRGPFDDRQR